jgi:hypothetical protein
MIFKIYAPFTVPSGGEVCILKKKKKKIIYFNINGRFKTFLT